MGTSRVNGDSFRLPTLRIVDLLMTEVQSVRIELVGRQSGVARVGTVMLYIPLLVVGYLLLLAALMRVVAVAWGWGMTCAIFGVVHVLAGVIGVARGGTIGAATSHQVVEPAVDHRPVAAPRAVTSDGARHLPMPFSQTARTAPTGVGPRPGSGGVDTKTARLP